METRILEFKCELLSDLVITQNAATQGNQETLDFIPGNVFLGVVASKYSEFQSNGVALKVFHSGKVKFGDAHPSLNNQRSFRVPAAWFRPKLKADTDNSIWVHHHLRKENFETLKEKQLKQERRGFYIIVNEKVSEVAVNKNFAIKSAYDSISRHSKDNAMFGYQSIVAGSEMIFEVAFTQDAIDCIDKVEAALIGEKYIGRSKSAQYGKVRISLNKDSSEICKTNVSDATSIAIYADSRLIFLDEYGIPTFTPKVEDFGLVSGTINWNKTQIRTFQYAPWNAKRQARDADRCGIEKGSVIVIENPKGEMFHYVGVYQNEGFGKVKINPEFLGVIENGIAKYSMATNSDNIESKEKQKSEATNNINSPLVNFLNKTKKSETEVKIIYEVVTKFVKVNSIMFVNSKNNFASQWGKIRSIAAGSVTDENLKDAVIDKYIHIGIAAEKWGNDKSKVLLGFIEDCGNKGINARLALINLATVMGKICSKSNKSNSDE